MRLKLLTNLNTLLLVTVCVALAATLWWSQRALQQPVQLMERYLTLSQQFQREVADRMLADILRRGHAGNESTTLRVADLELDLLRRRVSRNGKRIDLTAKEFGLLELLMRRQGEVLPRSLIASQVWDMPFGSDTNVIDVAVRRLRLKIDEGQETKMIFTVRGMGYMLEAPEQ